MNQSRRGIIHKGWSRLLAIIAVTVTTTDCFGQFDGKIEHYEPSNKVVRSSKAAVPPSAKSEERMTLEAARRGFEAQYQSSEESAEKAAREYREEALRDAPDKKELAKRKQALEAAVTASFKNQLMLQKTRLQLAELDLADLQARHLRRESLAKTIIERRIASLMSDEEVDWLPSKETSDDNGPNSGTESDYARGEANRLEAQKAVPQFATPHELIDFLEDAQRGDDAGKKLLVFVELVHHEELNRFAGVCLRTASVMRSACKLAEGFSAMAPDGTNAELIRMGGNLHTLIKNARLPRPPRVAQSAYEEISASHFDMFKLMLGGNGPEVPVVDADQYSVKLRKAAGVLKDPKRFIIDFLTLMGKFDNLEKDDATEQSNAGESADWHVTVEGDRATAIDHRTSKTASHLPFTPRRLDLVKVGETWKISTLFSDDDIIELQQGITHTKSAEEDKSDASATRSSYLPDEPNEPTNGETNPR